VAFHAAGLFVTSWLMSANANVVPQLFFQRHEADRKVLYLAACLVAGTLAAIAGVLASRRFAVSRAGALAILGATAAAEGGLFLVSGPLAFGALAAAAQLGSNFLTNHLDHAAAHAAGVERRRFQDGASNALRLLGMLVAPLFFALYFDRLAIVGGALAVTTALAFASTSSLLRAGDHAVADSASRPEGRPLEARDRLVFAFVVALYVALYLFAGNLIYLLRDVVRLPGAEEKGGLAILVNFAAALVANALTTLARRAEPGRVRRVAILAPVPLLAITTALLASGVPLTFAHVVVGCAGVGGSYGVFLAEVREYASWGARAEGKDALLSLYNNMGNMSSLLAYSALAAIAALRPGDATYGPLLLVIGALPAMATPALFLGLGRRRAEAAA
jgi:hypothetical protein